MVGTKEQSRIVRAKRQNPVLKSKNVHVTFDYGVILPKSETDDFIQPTKTSRQEFFKQYERDYIRRLENLKPAQVETEVIEETKLIKDESTPKPSTEESLENINNELNEMNTTNRSLNLEVIETRIDLIKSTRNTLIAAALIGLVFLILGSLI